MTDSVSIDTGSLSAILTDFFACFLVSLATEVVGVASTNLSVSTTTSIHTWNCVFNYNSKFEL